MLGYLGFLIQIPLIDWVNHSVLFSLNDSQHLIQCVKPLSLPFLSASIFNLSYSTMYSYVLDLDLLIYNISSDGDQATYYEQHVFHSLLKEFKMSSLRNYQNGYPLNTILAIISI